MSVQLTLGLRLTLRSGRVPSHGELWNNSADLYQGQTITRLDVASLGPDVDYHALMGLGLAAAFAVITATLPLLRRMTSPGSVHFE